jgi:hypothetical protein
MKQEVVYSSACVWAEAVGGSTTDVRAEAVSGGIVDVRAEAVSVSVLFGLGIVCPRGLATTPESRN